MTAWFNDISPDNTKDKDFARNRKLLSRLICRFSCCLGMYCSIVDIFRILSWVVVFLVCWTVSGDEMKSDPRIFATVFISAIVCFVALVWRCYAYVANIKSRKPKLIKQVSGWMLTISIIEYLVFRFSEERQFLQPSFVSSALLLMVLANILSVFQISLPRKGWLSYFFKVVVLLMWSYLMIRVVHQCYKANLKLQEAESIVQRMLFPYAKGSGVTGDGWISIGTTFFAGCLIIISWSREKPCKAWNPFTAQELGMERNLLDFAIMSVIAMSYAVYNKLNNVSFFFVLLLLSTDVYTLFLCNSQHIDPLVRRKIIQNIDAIAITDRIESQPETGIGFWSGTKGNDIEHEVVYRDLIAFSQTIAKISENCFVSDRRTWNKARDIVLLANDICSTHGKEKKNGFYTIAFIYGMSCLPDKLMNRFDPARVSDYATSLCECAGQQNTYNDFFEYFQCGVHYAIWSRNPVKDIKNIDYAYLKARGSDEDHTGEFISWILGEDNSIHKNWYWFNEIRNVLR